jgi:hypothetical protein
MKITVFWDVASYRLVETDRLSEALTVIIGAVVLVMEAVRTSESPVSFYQTTWRLIPEDSRLQTSLKDPSTRFKLP